MSNQERCWVCLKHPGQQDGICDPCAGGDIPRFRSFGFDAEVQRVEDDLLEQHRAASARGVA